MDADEAAAAGIAPSRTGPGAPRTDLESGDGDERYGAVRQYSVLGVLGVWAAAAIPMGVLSWVVAPWLANRLEGTEPLDQALIVCLTAGLVWQFVLVLILMRHELGTLRWSRLRDASWLRSPRDPKTGRVGGRVWWWVLLFVFLTALLQLVPGPHGPSPRDFAQFLASDSGEAFFHGAWGWYALVVVFVLGHPPRTGRADGHPPRTGRAHGTMMPFAIPDAVARPYARPLAARPVPMR